LVSWKKQKRNLEEWGIELRSWKRNFIDQQTIFPITCQVCTCCITTCWVDCFHWEGGTKDEMERVIWKVADNSELTSQWAATNPRSLLITVDSCTRALDAIYRCIIILPIRPNVVYAHDLMLKHKAQSNCATCACCQWHFGLGQDRQPGGGMWCDVTLAGLATGHICAVLCQSLTVKESQLLVMTWSWHDFWLTWP
jgi:hypothetical protein